MSEQELCHCEDYEYLHTDQPYNVCTQCGFRNMVWDDWEVPHEKVVTACMRNEKVKSVLLQCVLAVEWVVGPQRVAGKMVARCPWCLCPRADGHAPDCQRQASLKKAGCSDEG